MQEKYIWLFELENQCIEYEEYVDELLVTKCVHYFVYFEIIVTVLKNTCIKLRVACLLLLPLRKGKQT